MAPPSHSHAHTTNASAPKNGFTVDTMPPCLLDSDEFRRQGYRIIDFVSGYYARMEDYSVSPKVTPGFLRSHLPVAAPSQPEPDALAAALDDVRDLILPGITHWQSPRHFAHFPASSSSIGALGEALAAGLNVVPFTWTASPAATELEMVVVDWLARALHLPESFMFAGGGGGTFLGTSCEAILCTLVTARDRKLAEVGECRMGDLVVYCSDQTHFAFHKAAHIAGIRKANCRVIATRREDQFALSPAMVKSAMQMDVDAGMVPLFLCASVGTTPTTAVDPVPELCVAVAPHGVWVHVDAAYAGSAFICPEFLHLADGVEAVDSISMNPHKWLVSNNDCCALWLKQPSTLVAALGTNRDDVILKDAATDGDGVVDYKDWSVTLTRRFRALKVWLVFRCYGTDALRDVVRAHVRLAVLFEQMVRGDARCEVVAPRRFALVCFRLRPPAAPLGGAGDSHVMANKLNKTLLEAVNRTSRGPYMSSATVGGEYLLRCAVGSTLTEERHVRDAWKVVQDQGTAILREMGWMP
ncbi:hypothetical protein HU200_007709 [Digitaria exilis]|uniref:Tyrosine decarboxylase n=1 Tax=Digitaria exilis TaxID=1010633 RepID=A0A835FPR5_9POAL|nr:hypothetical protein HU200_007709 [Digitaria exilis]